MVPTNHRLLLSTPAPTMALTMTRYGVIIILQCRAQAVFLLIPLPIRTTLRTCYLLQSPFSLHIQGAICVSYILFNVHRVFCQTHGTYIVLFYQINHTSLGYKSFTNHLRFAVDQLIECVKTALSRYLRQNMRNKLFIHTLVPVQSRRKVTKRHGKGLVPGSAILDHESQWELISCVAILCRLGIDRQKVPEDACTRMTLASAAVPRWPV